MAEHTCQEQGESSAQSSNCLQWQSILVRSRVSLQLKPVPTLAPLGCPLAEPHPLDVCVLLVAHTAHHPVVVHSIHNVRLILSALAPSMAFKKKGSRFPACFANTSYFSKPVACSTPSGIIWSAFLTADRWTSLLDALHLAKLELTWYMERESKLAMVLSLVEVNQAILACDFRHGVDQDEGNRRGLSWV